MASSHSGSAPVLRATRVMTVIIAAHLQVDSSPGVLTRSGSQKLAEAVDTAFGEAGPHPGGVVVVDLHKDLAFPVQGGEDVAPLVGHRQLDNSVEGPEPIGQRLQEHLDVLTADG